MVAPENFIWGRGSPGVWKTEVPHVGFRDEALVENLGNSSPETEAVYNHCLQILTAETTKIQNCDGNLDTHDSSPICFTLGEATFCGVLATTAGLLTQLVYRQVLFHYIRYELSPNYVPIPFASKSGGRVPQLLWERRP